MARDSQPFSRDQGYDPTVDARGTGRILRRFWEAPVPHRRAATARYRRTVSEVFLTGEHRTPAVLCGLGTQGPGGAVGVATRGGDVSRPQRLSQVGDGH